MPIGCDDNLRERNWYAVYSALTWYLSPAWGAMGVAIAFSSTEILLHPWLFSMHGLKSLGYKKFLPEILVGAVFTGLLWIFAQRNLWAGFLCGVFYLALWYRRNLKILVSARKDLYLDWYRAPNDLVVPANR